MRDLLSMMRGARAAGEGRWHGQSSRGNGCKPQWLVAAAGHKKFRNLAKHAFVDTAELRLALRSDVCLLQTMLIDIFARRYENVQIRDGFEERDRRLLLQAFRILSEDLYPYYTPEGKESDVGVAFWTSIQNQLSRELGLKELSALWFTYTTKWNGIDHQNTTKWALVKVCENWMSAPIAGSPDTHIKERLSLIELGFRQRENEIALMNAKPIITRSVPKPAPMLSASVGRMPIPDSNGYADKIRQQRAVTTGFFQSAINELNARFRQASYTLHYHNGFIQASTDELVQTTVETPFWALVADPRWANVDTDMKEALDLRDSDGRDPAFFAARALESAIKITCEIKGWVTGKEVGASNYIDQLGAKSHGFLDTWEVQSLRDFFKQVRNPLSHGAGSATMPSLTRPQVEWAIEFSMSWIKSLVHRL